MRKIVSSVILLCLCGMATAQTFTFECFGGFLTTADANCDICNTQVQSRLFSGLLVRKNGVVSNWIDCPYIVRAQGNNLVFQEIIPNPQSVTISLAGTGFSTLQGFKDSTACMCARQDSSWAAQVLSAGDGATATDKTVLLSGGGGAVVFREGTNVTLSRTVDTITINATSGGSTFYQTWKDDGTPLTQRPNANFLQSSDVNLILADDAGNTETEVSADILPNAVDYAEIQQVSANRLLGNPTGSPANVAEIPLATGLFFSGGNLNVADRDSLNEAWTIDADDADSEVISNQVVKFEGAGINVTDYVPGTNTLIITGTEVDGSVTNEAWTIDADAGDTEVISNQTVLIAGGGIVSTTYNAAANTLTVTGTEVDGSTTNELQTIANTSNATSHTATLSNSGGSVQLVEGTGIALATTGTALDGVVTITNSAPDQTVTITGGGINVVTGTYPNFTVTGTEVDGSITNEGSLTVGAGGANTSTIVSNTSASTPVTVSGSNTILVTESGSTITLQADTSLLATVNDMPREPAHNIVYGTGTGLDSESWFQSDPTDDNLKIGPITADSGIVNITQPSGFGTGNAGIYARDVVNLLKYKRGVMPAWYVQQKAVSNGDGSSNNVLEIIYNTFAGGNEETAADANFGISMEPHWIAADGDTVSEWHVFFNDQKGGVHRPLTGFFNYHKPEENSWGFSVDKSYFNGNLANKRAKVSINMTNPSLGAYPLEVYKHKNTITTTSASYTRSELDSVTALVIGNYNTGSESPQLGLSSLMRWSATQDRRAQFYLGLVDMTGSGFDAGTDFVGYYQNSGVFKEAFRVRDDFGYFGIKLTGGNQPTQPLHVNGNARITGAIYDSNNDPGTPGQILSTTGTTTDWIAPATGTVTGTGVDNQVATWSGTTSLDGSANYTYDGSTLSILTASNSATNNVVIRNTSSGSSATGVIRFWNDASTASNAGMQFQMVSSGFGSPYTNGFAYWLNNNANQIWATNNAAQMLLNTSGLYLGGAVSPSQRLHVNGNAYVTGNISIGVSSASQPLHVNGKSYFVDDIGVGITPPTARVHAVGTANNTIVAQSSNTIGTSFQVKNTSASGGDFTFSTTGSANAYGAGWFLGYDNTALATRYAISPTGNFGITDDLTIPRKLYVEGETRITDLATDTPTKIVGADADGDLDTVGIGAEGELHITAGTLGTNFHTVISPAQLTAAATNNWNPTGLATAWIIRMSGDGDFSWLTGITAPAFGKELTLINVGTNAMLLTTENTLSSAANRFSFGRDVVLFPGKSCKIFYDVTTARWRLLSQGGLYDDVQHVYLNQVFTAPTSGITADYDFWEITSPTVSGIAPVSGRWSGVGVNTGSSSTGLGYVASKDVFFETNAATNTATWAYCKAVIKTPSSLSDGSNDYSLRVGFNASTGGAGATDGAYFNYNHGLSSGAWACHTTNGGSTQSNSSGVTVAAATTYVLEVVIRPGLVVEFFIDGVRVASNDTFVPSGDDMKVLAEIQKSVGTTSREMNVYTLQTSVALVK